ncbi:MAG: DUF418 domain-containing protein [Chloroflexota bacterium]
MTTTLLDRTNKQNRQEIANTPSRTRIIGYDIARTLAFIGMVIVNFKLVMGASEAGPNWLVWLTGLLEGRAAALFVVLAGVGISLLSKKARLTNDQQSIARKRTTLLKRAAFLFIVGLLYTPIWPPDILHFYGVYIAISAFLLLASDRQLLAIATGFIGAFVILFLLFDYDQGWEWDTLTYVDFWTLEGMVRHLFFNGFHPALPWTAFLIIGMWLGRQDVHNPVVRRRILVISLVIAALAETLSFGLIRIFANPIWEISAEEVQAIFGTAMIPPMPLYMIAAAATAVAVIMICIMLTDRAVTPWWVKSLVVTGQLALTLYVAHVVIGMGFLEAFGLLENQTLLFSLGSAVVFSFASIIFAHFWSKRFQRGPLESVMRRLTT